MTPVNLPDPTVTVFQMVANVEYAKVIVNSDLKVSMVTKKCTNAWTFTVTSKVTMVVLS